MSHKHGSWWYNGDFFTTYIYWHHFFQTGEFCPQANKVYGIFATIHRITILFSSWSRFRLMFVQLLALQWPISLINQTQFLIRHPIQSIHRSTFNNLMIGISKHPQYPQNASKWFREVCSSKKWTALYRHHLVDFMQPNLTGGASENSVGTISSSVSGYSSRDVPPTSFIHIDPLNDDMIRFDPSWTSCSTGLVTVQYRWSCHYQYFGFLAPFPILSVSRSSINTQKRDILSLICNFYVHG